MSEAEAAGKLELGRLTEQSKTEYLIFQQTPERTWTSVGKVNARAAADALRDFLKGRDDLASPDSTFVSVPARSWKPVKVTPKVATTLVFEDA